MHETAVAHGLVGRDDELARIARAADQLADGCSGVLVVTGEPGIGKSRMLDALAREAGTRGFVTLDGRCSELETDRPFAVFVDALDDHVASLAANPRGRPAVGPELAAVLRATTPGTAPWEALRRARHRRFAQPARSAAPRSRGGGPTTRAN